MNDSRYGPSDPTMTMSRSDVSVRAALTPKKAALARGESDSTKSSAASAGGTRAFMSSMLRSVCGHRAPSGSRRGHGAGRWSDCVRLLQAPIPFWFAVGRHPARFFNKGVLGWCYPIPDGELVAAGESLIRQSVHATVRLLTAIGATRPSGEGV